MDRLTQLQAFVSVAETESFTAAARSLGVTTSAISKQVQALEERLDVRLFNRTTRRVSLREDARAYYERVRELVADLEESEQALTRLGHEPRGRLRIGAPMDFARRHLARPLTQFARDHPRLELDVELSDRFADLVEEGFDVVVRIGEMRDSSLVARRIAPCRRVICASPEYWQANGRPRRIQDLREHQRIGYGFESEAGWRFRDRATRLRLPVRHHVNNGDLLKEMALAGMGIALLPTFLASQELREGRLVAVFTDVLDEDIAIHAIYPHRKQLSLKVRRFVDFLVEHCGTRPYWDQDLGFD